jgi:uncharacterized protein
VDPTYELQRRRLVTPLPRTGGGRVAMRGARPVGRQLWRDLLFLHQPVPISVLRPLVPPGLGIDTYEGEAWVTLIPFAVLGSRPAGAPRALAMDFLEVNLRTYVRCPAGEQGIYFFSLEASSWLAVTAARLAYALPYFPAAIHRRKDADGAIIRYRSRRRLARHAPGLDMVWHIGAPAPLAAPGSLDHFLIERYVLFAARGRRIYRAAVQHRPYPLYKVSVALMRESLLARAGLPPMSSSPPLIHGSSGVDVDLYWRHRIDR